MTPEELDAALAAADRDDELNRNALCGGFWGIVITAPFWVAVGALAWWFLT